MIRPADVQAVATQLNRVAKAITADAAIGTDATGSAVGSLTEAVMGMTAGLLRIAESIQNLADAVADRGDSR